MSPPTKDQSTVSPVEIIGGCIVLQLIVQGPDMEQGDVDAPGQVHHELRG